MYSGIVAYGKNRSAVSNKEGQRLIQSSAYPIKNFEMEYDQNFTYVCDIVIDNGFHLCCRLIIAILLKHFERRSHGQIAER